MKIEAGKDYRSRDGEKWIDARPRGTTADGRPIWIATAPDGGACAFYEDGGYVGANSPHGFDLVAEWRDIDLNSREFLQAQYELATRLCTDDGSPMRVQILHEGAKLTDGNRDAEYGPPAVNLACAGELKAVIRKYMKREISPGELEAIDQVCTKLGRVATGMKPKRDTYVDGATYFAIAGEIALSEVDVSVSGV